jgi:hypothetical protein
MTRIELSPTVEECIETMARRRFHRLTESILRGEKPENKTVQEIELLRQFLETADFARLRAESEKELHNGRRVTFQVFQTHGGVTHRMQVT